MNRYADKLLALLQDYIDTSETQEERRAWQRIYNLARNAHTEYQVMIENLRQDAALGQYVDILPAPDDEA